MKTGRKMIALILAATMILALASCGGGNGQSSNGSSGSGNGGGNNGQVYTLKIGNTVSDIDPTNEGYQYFKEILEERTNGQIQVSIFSRSEERRVGKECRL